MAKRPIFTEATQTDAPVSPAGTATGRSPAARRWMRIWLGVLFALVVTMIAVGGLTRLTDSGLSITEWRPVTGALPPMSDAAWAAEFEKYRQIPEYQLQNKGMSLAEFQFIYWWEWGHRQLGRFIGLVWAIGFIGFLLAGQLKGAWRNRALMLGGLGGLQGAIGWWMVSSGLGGQMLDVASYRLATHLGLAFVILGLISWYFFLLGQNTTDLMQARRRADMKGRKLSTGLMHFAFLQILIGALVAGIDAGRNYIDWPLMAGGIFPPEPFSITPLWRNFFENDGLVQFIHRLAGYLLFTFGTVAWLRMRKNGNRHIRGAFHLVMAVMLIQMLLGIVTVMHSAPLSLAILHQFGAVLLWVAIIRARFTAMHPPFQSVREG